MTNFTDPKYHGDPETLELSDEELLEQFEDYAIEGLKPEEIVIPEVRQQYVTFLASWVPPED